MNVHDYMQRLSELLAATDLIIKERDEARRERDEAGRRAASEIEELRKELDDARLEIWEHHPRTTLGAREYADARGWAPFMEENDNA